MPPQELKEARHKLGLSLSQLALMLGCEGTQAAQQMRKMNLATGPYEMRKCGLYKPI